MLASEEEDDDDLDDDDDDEDDHDAGRVDYVVADVHDVAAGQQGAPNAATLTTCSTPTR